MKTLTNGNTTGGIGTISRYSMDYHAKNPSAGELVVVSPNYLSLPKDADGRVSLYEYPCDLVSPLGHSIDSFRALYQDDIRKLGDIMETEGVDLVHPNGTYYYPWLLSNAAKERGLPLVIEFADILENEASDPLWHKMTGESVDVENRGYIFPSDLTRRTAEEIHGVKFRKHLVSYNGLDEVYFDDDLGRLDSIDSGDGLNIGFVGRISSVKNPEYLSHLCSILKEAGIPANVYCVSGSSNNFHEGPKLDVYKSLVDSGVKFPDSMSAENLSRFYRSMDFVVSPSRFETFGNVPLEALASGTRALVNRNMGVAEVFDSVDLSNYVVDFENDAAVVDILREGKRDKERVSGEVRATLREQFNWNKILSERAKFKTDFLAEQ